MPVPRFASVILILSFLLQIALCRREEEAIFDAGALSFWKPAHQSLAELREDNGVYKELTSGCGWTKRRYDISGTLVTDLNALAQALEAAAADARYLAAALEASRASGPHVTQSDANKEGECSEAVVLAAEKVIGASKEIRDSALGTAKLGQKAYRTALRLRQSNWLLRQLWRFITLSYNLIRKLVGAVWSIMRVALAVLTVPLNELYQLCRLLVRWTRAVLGSEARAIVQTVLAFAWRGLRGLPQIPVLAWRHIVYMTEPARSKATLVVVLIWRAIESGVTFLTRTLSGADEAAEGAGARLAALLDWAVSAVAGVLRWALDMGRWHAVWSAIVRWALSSLSGVWAVLREIGRSIAEAVARVLSEAVNIPDWIAFLAKYLRELWDARDMRGLVRLATAVWEAVFRAAQFTSSQVVRLIQQLAGMLDRLLVPTVTCVFEHGEGISPG